MEQRTYKVGRLSELKRQRKTVRIEIDAMAKSIVLHFEPMDQDLAYVDKIDPERLMAYNDSIARKVKVLTKVNAEIKALVAELGESE